MIDNPTSDPTRRDGHRLSAVIPTIGRASLEPCLASLRSQTRPPDEIIVVDDAARRGSAWARNEGIRRSRSDLIAFVDDDVVLPTDWLERLTRAIDTHDAAGAGGGLEETEPFLQEIRVRRKRYAGRKPEERESGGKPPEGGTLRGKVPARRQLGGKVPGPRGTVLERRELRGNGGLVLYRREWLDVCDREDGYVFNESLRHSGEDWELVLRLRRRGAGLVEVPVTARHLRRTSAVGFLRDQFRRGRGIAQLLALQRAVGAVLDPQPSLLWDQRTTVSGAGWMRVLWFKAVGPFDVGSFSSLRHFGLFWLGEKAQGAGFAREAVRAARQHVEKPRRRDLQPSG